MIASHMCAILPHIFSDRQLMCYVLNFGELREFLRNKCLKVYLDSLKNQRFD